MMLVGAYTRLSNDPDGTADATERQWQAIQGWCAERDWPIVDHYQDSDFSAYKKGVVRPEFERMMGDLERGRINRVVVWKIDRLTRRPDVLERFLDLADRTDCSVESMTEGLPLGSMGRFILRQGVNMANYASAQTSERIKDKWAYRARNGEKGGGLIPFGYGPGMVVIPEEADLIRDAHQRVIDGETLGSLSADWNSRGLVGRRGRPWTGTTIKSVLTRPLYAGWRVHQGRIIGDAVWESIIDRDTFGLVTSILTDPGRRPAQGLHDYLLGGGLTVCGVCGKAITSNNINKRPRYRCPAKKRGGCGGPSCWTVPLDSAVTAEFFAASEMVQPEAPLQQARRSLADARARLSILAEMLGTGELSRPEYVAARRPLVAEIEILEKAAVAPPRVLPADVQAGWANATLGQKRQMLKVLIDHVVLFPAHAAGARTFTSDRYKIVWR